ncbi:MAG: lamin tail domain-containing protein [Minicystis sp.]
MGAAGVLALAACNPDLPSPHPPPAGTGGQGGSASSTTLSVTTEPAAPLTAAPRVLRLRVDPPQPLDPTLIAFVRGDVGPGHLRQLAKREPSSALSERILPVLSWRDGAALVIAPTVVLDPGEHYTLALAELRETVPIDVAEDDPVPLLRRLWPPEGSVGPEPVAVWCGEVDLPPIDVPVDLAPGGPRGWIKRGVIPEGAGQRCVRFEARPVGRGEESWVAPPLVAAADPALTVRLDPSPLRTGAMRTEVPVLTCDADEITFGPGCVRVADDRVFGRSPPVPLLWAVAGPGVDSVLTTGPGDPFAITGLPPATDAALDVGAIDARGTVLRMLVRAVTTTPMPHVVLNEVLANPLGPEPSAEWVEIVNDGQAPVDLGGYTLVDGGGETVLPPATLAPGAFALVVNEAYVEEDGVDPAPAPGTVIVRVAHLGKNGLSNSGEPLVIHDPNGMLVSAFPAAPKPKAGKSVARRTPVSPDAAPASFAIAEPSPGRSNLW